jgi:predicted outer membrane repeat protein
MTVKAVFPKVYVITDFSDASGSATVAGRLRHALTNALDGATIYLDKETAGKTVIELTARLPDITKSITIEGNGVTLTRASTWTATSDSTQLMCINNSAAEVTISRVWFKDSSATSYGGAIRSEGTVNLESCIFSGNRTTSSTFTGGGGAIWYSGTLNVKGCTFYNNRSAYQGGAIYAYSGLPTLTGNLFYGNTAGSYPVVYSSSGGRSSGWNVVDVELGTGTAQSGFANSTGNDTTIAALLGTNTTTPFADETTLAPKSQLNIIPSSFAGNMPATDFYGEARTWPGAPGAVR